jgi:PadR family transcriptional regulator PadR
LPRDQTNPLQGTLDVMILKALALGNLLGPGVSRRIEQITKGTFQVKPGALPGFASGGRTKAGWSPLGESRKTRGAPDITS